MHGPTRVGLVDLLHENLRAVDGAAGGGDAGDEDLRTVCLERVLDASPVRDLKGGDGRSEGDGVEAEKAVAEHDWVLRARNCTQRELNKRR